MPCHHAQHTRNVWPILRNENIAHVMPCVTACAVTSCMHHTGKPAALIIRGTPGFTYGWAVHAS